MGLLFGDSQAVRDTIALVNHTEGSDRFHLRGAEIAAAREQAAPLTLIGRYHTHPPSRPRPSPEDDASLPRDWLELIVCVEIAAPGQGNGRRRIAGLHAYDHSHQHLELVIDADAAGRDPA